jgi:putative flippase GtrA
VSKLPEHGGKDLSEMGTPRGILRRFWTEQRLSKLALLAAFGCAAVLVVMVFNTAVSKNVGVVGKIGLAAVGVIGAAVTLFANKDFTLKPAKYTDWLTRTNVAAVLLALYAGYSMMGGFASLLDPQAAVESAPQAIETAAASAAASSARVETKVDDVRDILAERLPEAPARAPVLDQIPGQWGEVGCAVIWTMKIEGEAFLAEVTTRPAGFPPYAFVGDIVSAQGQELNLVGEKPDAARGQSATITVDKASAVARLTWTDRARAAPLVLEPCGPTHR